MVHRWYLTPSRLSKMYKHLANVCWRCGGNNGDMLHMWWTCGKIKIFWGKIYDELKEMLGITFKKRPEVILLNIFDKDIPMQSREVFLYATAAARILVAKGWKEQEVPRIIDWQVKVHEYAEMAQLTNSLRGKSKQQFSEKWDGYKKYVHKYCNNSLTMPAFE